MALKVLQGWLIKNQGEEGDKTCLAWCGCESPPDAEPAMAKGGGKGVKPPWLGLQQSLGQAVARAV